MGGGGILFSRDGWRIVVLNVLAARYSVLG